MKILVAEDDKANQMVTSLWLDEFGYDHEVAEDGEETIEKFKTGKFSIILMDVGMHKINGYEATKSIRAIEKSNKLKPAIIIAFTARGFLGDREKCLQSGMDDYLSKPIDYMALNNYLAKYSSAALYN